MKIKQTEEMKAGRMARKAAALIRKHGWMKGGAGDKERGLCVRAALAVAYSDNWALWHQGAGGDLSSMMVEDKKSGSFKKVPVVTPKKPIGQACNLFAKWLFPEPTDKYILINENEANIWNDGKSPVYKSLGDPKFPCPESGEEVAAILDKFADEMDPQK